MKFRALLLGVTALLSGCIIFDKKSEAVTFHQLASPAAVASRTAPTLFLPRAIIPSALRRPNVVLIDDTGWVRIEDAHRWVAPLDRAVPEAVGRHLTSLTGLPSTTQSPTDDHLILLLTIDKMEICSRGTESLDLLHPRNDGEYGHRHPAAHVPPRKVGRYPPDHQDAFAVPAAQGTLAARVRPGPIREPCRRRRRDR